MRFITTASVANSRSPEEAAPAVLSTPSRSLSHAMVREDAVSSTSETVAVKVTMSPSFTRSPVAGVRISTTGAFPASTTTQR